MSLSKPPTFVFHIIPGSIGDPNTEIDIDAFEKQPRIGIPIRQVFCNYRINVDGILAYGKRKHSSDTEFYLQIFDNGSFEAVYTEFLFDQTKRIDHFYEFHLVNELTVYLSLQKSLGIQTPIFVMLSVLNVRNYTMDYQQSFFRKIGDPSKNMGFVETQPKRETPLETLDHLFIPKIKINSFECDTAKELRPIFKKIWRATGWSDSQNYDSNGNLYELGIERIK